MAFYQHKWRFLPQPLMTVVLWVLWLMLNHSVSAGHLLLGLFVAWLIPFIIQPMMDPQPSVNKPLVAFRYVLRLLLDIIVSNIEVAAQVLGPLKNIQPGFLAYPLELQQDLSITLLASTISLTPGTLSAELSEDRKWLYIHSLNLDNEEQTIETIKSRYERPLKEIFGC